MNLTDILEASGFEVPEPTSDINTGATRAMAQRAGQLQYPLYGDGINELDIPNASQGQFDSACTNAEHARGQLSPVDLEVLIRFVQLSHLIPLKRETYQRNAEDWQFAPLRCVIAGAGFANWKTLAELANSLYADCPFEPDETEIEFNKLNFQARRMCGWPIIFIWLDMHAVVQAFSPAKPSDIPVAKWAKALALLHMLKHVRTMVSNPKTLTMAYHGRAKAWEVQDPQGAVADSPRLHNRMTQDLGGRAAVGKSIHMPTEAIRWALTIPIRNWLPRLPLTSLPLHLLTGPWARLLPDPRALSGFIQHGCSVSGLWAAQNGKITEYLGEDLVMRHEWSFDTVDNVQQQNDFTASLPTTYAMGSPFGLLYAAYPNIVLDHHLNPVALQAVFDAIVVADLWRSNSHTYDREFPLVIIQPADPTLAGSTNTGKSYCAEVIARTFAPGIPVVRAKDSSSAPDSRVLADAIRQYGMVCLDEWQVYRSTTTMLNETDLHTLCTGGSIVSGRAMENGVKLISLRHPIVASSKAADLNLDLQSRTFGIWLRDLTAAERSNTAAIAQVESGGLSLAMRLAAIGLAENQALQQAVQALGRTSAQRGGFRFANTGAIAAVLLAMYTGVPLPDAVTGVDRCANEVIRKIGGHIDAASASGVLASMRAHRKILLSVSEMFSPEIMPITRLDEIMQLASKYRPPNTNYSTPKQFWGAWSEAMGIAHLPLKEQLAVVCSEVPSTVNELTMSRALTEAFSNYIPAPQAGATSERPLPLPFSADGYVIRRAPDVHGQLRLALVRNTASARNPSPDSIPLTDMLTFPPPKEPKNA